MKGTAYIIITSFILLISNISRADNPKVTFYDNYAHRIHFTVGDDEVMYQEERSYKVWAVCVDTKQTFGVQQKGCKSFRLHLEYDESKFFPKERELVFSPRSDTDYYTPPSKYKSDVFTLEDVVYNILPVMLTNIEKQNIVFNDVFYKTLEGYYLPQAELFFMAAGLIFDLSHIVFMLPLSITKKNILLNFTENIINNLFIPSLHNYEKTIKQDIKCELNTCIIEKAFYKSFGTWTEYIDKPADKPKVKQLGGFHRYD